MITRPSGKEKDIPNSYVTLTYLIPNSCVTLSKSLSLSVADRHLMTVFLFLPLRHVWPFDSASAVIHSVNIGHH